MSQESINGEFFITRVRNGNERNGLGVLLTRFRNGSESYQRDLMTADWKPLKCPFCKEEAEPPVFPQGADPFSHKLTHACGSTYYVDRSDNRCEAEWNEIRGTRKDWKIVHNYHILIGKTASNLHPDFDIIDDDSQITHVVFLKPRLEITGNLETLFDR